MGSNQETVSFNEIIQNGVYVFNENGGSLGLTRACSSPKAQEPVSGGSVLQQGQACKRTGLWFSQ